MTTPNAVLNASLASAARRSTPRFGGVPLRLSRLTNPLTLRLAGKHWNPIFAVVVHTGRRSGRSYRTTVAARRIEGGFIISLAFGPQVDWYRNPMAAGSATVRWRGTDYAVTDLEVIDAEIGRAAFHPVQRLLVRLAGISGYVRLHDVADVAAKR